MEHMKIIQKKGNLKKKLLIYMRSLTYVDIKYIYAFLSLQVKLGYWFYISQN